MDYGELNTAYERRYAAGEASKQLLTFWLYRRQARERITLKWGAQLRLLSPKLPKVFHMPRFADTHTRGCLVLA